MPGLNPAEIDNDNAVKPATVTFISKESPLPDGSKLDEDKERKAQENADGIGMYVIKEFQTSYDSRRNAQEDILLDAERAYRNKYSMEAQTELAKRQEESGDSTVWIPYTRPKTNIAIAKTFEKMLNSANNPWTIQPDELSQEDIQKNITDIMRAAQSGVLQEDPEKALEKLNDYTQSEKREACDKMEAEIAEQMRKGNAFGQLSKTIIQQHYLGTGAAKFSISIHKETQWVKNDYGQWELQTTEIPFPKVSFVSLFDLFFDPYALSVEESRYVIERHVLKRSDVIALKQTPGFFPGRITQLISDNPYGNHTNLDYETTIRGINEQDQNDRGSDGYYDVFEYWGEMGGDTLINAGITEVNGQPIDETDAYSVECWVCAGRALKLDLNPFTPQRIPYFIVPYQENTHTIYATGVPEEIFGVQEVINSLSRSVVDNAAFSHAPMAEVNVDLLKNGQKAEDAVKPRAVMLREGGDPDAPLVRYYQPVENSEVLYRAFDLFNQIGIDATGISSSSEESMPAANAANAGISMALTQKNILQRTVVSNIDTYLIKPMIEMYYNFNMQWADNEEIKVPAHITANGVTSIIAKEMRAQQLLAFAQLTSNEVDSKIVNRRGLLEELAASLDQDPENIVQDETEIEEQQQAEGEAAMQAAKAQEQSIINQINTENAGELEQERVKGQIALRKQMLIEQARLAQIAAKEQADITAREQALLADQAQRYQGILQQRQGFI